MDSPTVVELGQRPTRLDGFPIVKVFDVSTQVTRWYVGDVLIGTLTAVQLVRQDEAHPRLVMQGETSKFRKSRNDWAVFDYPCVAEVDIDWPAIRAGELDRIARGAGGNGWLRETWTLPEVAPPDGWLGVDPWAGKR